MMNFLLITLSLSCVTLSSLSAGDLSRYRDFQLDTNLLAVVKQARTELAEAKVIHQRPALIQELSWRPRRPVGLDADSVKDVVFSFYNGELFRMVVTYDRYTTEGLTAEDLIEAISATYGTTLNPAAEIILPSIYDENESVKVIARWEDSKYSFNLVRPSYRHSFVLVVLSKRLDVLARAAVVEAVRLDKQQAPQREIERQNKEDERNRVLQEKARLLNKPGFRP
jgi:hypothetical protein